MEKIYESIKRIIKLIITEVMSVEMIKLGIIFTCATVAYWAMNANEITGILVAFLPVLCPIIYTIGYKKGNKTIKRLSVLPAVIAAVIVVCGNPWVLLILFAQCLLGLLFIEPAKLAQEIDNMN